MIFLRGFIWIALAIHAEVFLFGVFGIEAEEEISNSGCKSKQNAQYYFLECKFVQIGTKVDYVNLLRIHFNSEGMYKYPIIGFVPDS